MIPKSAYGVFCCIVRTPTTTGRRGYSSWRTAGPVARASCLGWTICAGQAASRRASTDAAYTTARELGGCIALGRSFGIGAHGQKMITDSRATVGEFMARLGGVDFELVIS